LPWSDAHVIEFDDVRNVQLVRAEGHVAAFAGQQRAAVEQALMR
jgi:hypothetical protein